MERARLGGAAPPPYLPAGGADAAEATPEWHVLQHLEWKPPVRRTATVATHASSLPQRACGAPGRPPGLLPRLASLRLSVILTKVSARRHQHVYAWRKPARVGGGHAAVDEAVRPAGKHSRHGSAAVEGTCSWDSSVRLWVGSTVSWQGRAAQERGKCVDWGGGAARLPCRPACCVPLSLRQHAAPRTLGRPASSRVGERGV